jgi:hypothetical protein
MASKAADVPMNWNVADFLDRFKAAVQLRRYWWDNCEKRQQELADLGMQFQDALDGIMKLEVRHHQRGPQPDDIDFDCCAIHIFRYSLAADIDVYVKIGVKAPPGKTGLHIAKIWSFKRWTPFAKDTK